MDYSIAQTEGFVLAFVAWGIKCINGWDSLGVEAQDAERRRLRERAKELVKGCIVHWKRSLNRIKEIVEPAKRPSFDGLIAVLEDRATSPQDFLDTSRDLLRDFPEIRGWAVWWLRLTTGGMIFPAIQNMSPELRDKLPSSTNGAESNHWLLYRACGEKHDLVEGIERLYKYVGEIERLYKSVQSEFYFTLCWSVSKMILGGVVRVRPASAREFSAQSYTFENDGRAPDTRNLLRLAAEAEVDLDGGTELAGRDEHPRTAPSERQARVTENALAELRQLTKPKKTTHNATRSQKAGSSKTAWITMPAIFTEHNFDDMRLLLQSYVWEKNSCYIDAPLELLYRAWAFLDDNERANILAITRSAGERKPSKIDLVFHHFEQRYLYMTQDWTIPVAKNAERRKKEQKRMLEQLKASLEIGRSRVRGYILSDWDSFAVEGKFGCARQWLGGMGLVSSQYIIPFSSC